MSIIPLRPPISRRRVWWLAARPATLAASVAPVLAGTAVAVRFGGVRPWAGAGALLVAIAMQLGVNYANDYSDFVRGTDARRVGPLRAAASGMVKPSHVRAAAIAAFGVAAGLGIAVSLATDWRLLVAGALAIVAGWLYTGGPRPYGYLGLGELFVFVFFGLFAAAGTTYVEIGSVPALSWLAGVFTGALACAILALNNLRDIDTDRNARKRTLAVLLGRRATRALITALLAVAFAVPVAALAAGLSSKWVLEPLLLFPTAFAIHRATASTDPKQLVSALKTTAQLELWFALLWTAGVLSP